MGTYLLKSLFISVTSFLTVANRGFVILFFHLPDSSFGFLPKPLLHVAEEVLAGYRGQVVHRNVSVKKSLHFGYLILKLL